MARPREAPHHEQEDQSGSDPYHRPSPRGQGVAGVKAGLPARDLASAFGAGVVARLDRSVAVGTLDHICRRADHTLALSSQLSAIRRPRPEAEMDGALALKADS